MSKHYQRSSRPALTLVEVVVATLIVGMMTVTALHALGAATRSSESVGRRATALGLADDLLAEIEQGHYLEPDADATFGTEPNESTSTRAAFDDVDDYDGWNAAPPEDREGTALSERAQWRRLVAVDHVDPNDPTTTLSDATDSGLKRIRVTIQFADATVLEQVIFVSHAWHGPWDETTAAE